MHPSQASAPAPELSEEAIRVSIQDPEHLKRWLLASGRPFLVFVAEDLVDSLSFPEGHDAFANLISGYGDRRRAIPSGETKTEKHFVTGEPIEVMQMKGELLTKTETDRAIRFLVGQMLALDPSWSLEAPAL